MVILKDKKKYAVGVNQSHVLQRAIVDSIKQLNPFLVIKNPILFIVEICFFITLILSINSNFFGPSILTKKINLIFSILLLLTILFSNLAENFAKHIYKNQAESLNIVHGDIEVKRVLVDGNIEYIFASQLEKGDIIKMQQGDLIPLDGEVISGVASVDESAITGESSPVLKEPGTDTSSSVTGGTRVLTDWLLVKITSEHGQTYLDQMVNIASGAERHKTPNELSLNTLLIASTISFLLVVVALSFILWYLKINVEITFLIALLVCLIPTTIGGLAAPIRISGFEKLNKLNIVAMSAKAIETSGDINVIFFDKTGTITFGNRMAMEFIPLGRSTIIDVAKIAYLASYYDQTPEGRSVLSLAKRYGIEYDIKDVKGIPHEFTAHTRMSGIDLDSGETFRKGAPDSIKKFVLSKGGKIWENTDSIVENIAIQGGTPLLVSNNNEIIGIVHLKDIVKPSMKNKFKEASVLGVKTIMCTGDNTLTAKVIANEAGIDEYVAQVKPEDKISMIRGLQKTGVVVSMLGDGTNDAPALAQADIGLAMNTGTVAAKEASNMIDLDSDPSKIIEIVKIGRELLTTRGALTTFSIINDISKYFAILPSIFTIPGLEALNIMHLHSELSSILSAMVFNTLIILIMTPFALRGVSEKNLEPNKLLQNNLIKFGLGGLIVPFIGIKLIDLILGRFFL